MFDVELKYIDVILLLYDYDDNVENTDKIVDFDVLLLIDDEREVDDEHIEFVFCDRRDEVDDEQLIDTNRVVQLVDERE